MREGNLDSKKAFQVSGSFALGGGFYRDSWIDRVYVTSFRKCAGSVIVFCVSSANYVHVLIREIYLTIHERKLTTILIE